MLSVSLTVLAVSLFCFHRCLSYDDFTPYFYLNYLILYLRAYFKTPFCVFSSVQSLSHVQLFTTPWTAACQASLSITNSQSLLKLMCIKSVMPSNHLIFCHPLLLPPSIFPIIRVFSNESALHIRWPKILDFQLQHQSFQGLISFRIDWLDRLAVQGTLKSLLQHYSSKASILWCSAFLYSPTLTSIHDYWKSHTFD